MAPRLDERCVDRERPGRTSARGECDALRKQRRNRRPSKLAGTAGFDDFEALLVVPVQQLVRDTAGRVLYMSAPTLRSRTTGRRAQRRAGAQNASHGHVGLKGLEPESFARPGLSFCGNYPGDMLARLKTSLLENDPIKPLIKARIHDRAFEWTALAAGQRMGFGFGNYLIPEDGHRAGKLAAWSRSRPRHRARSIIRYGIRCWAPRARNRNPDRLGPVWISRLRRPRRRADRAGATGRKSSHSDRPLLFVKRSRTSYPTHRFAVHSTTEAV